MTLNDDSIIYVDLDFVSRKFEELTGINPSTQISTARGGNATISIPLASGGVSSQETRMHNITSRSMLHKIWGDLQKSYKKFETFSNNVGTHIVWMDGNLTLAEWASPDKTDSYPFFQLNHENERTAFLSNYDYFSAGFASAIRASSALKGNISIPVKCLARIMWHVDDAKNYVACPYVIVEAC